MYKRQGIEIGLEKFLKDHDYQAVVTHFGDLGGLKQLPGLAIQRLMEKGYGFGAEGDWKTAAMVRLMKVMTAGKKDAKGTSFMEDYTYNFVPGKEGILEAHMLEVCPTIADGPDVYKRQKWIWEHCKRIAVICTRCSYYRGQTVKSWNQTGNQCLDKLFINNSIMEVYRKWEK